jgi:hypothetical protein
VSVTGRLGPFGVTVGGRRKRGWRGLGGPSAPVGGSYDDYYELTPEQTLALAKGEQVGAWQKREIVFIVASSRHMNRVMALLVATLGGIVLPADSRVWSVIVGAVTLIGLNVSRIYAMSYLRKRDRKLSALDESERKIFNDPESWYETFKMTSGRRWVNTLLLVALSANLVWVYAADPKPEEPGVVAAIVFSVWILARLIIFAGEVGIGPARFFVNVCRIVAVWFLFGTPLIFIPPAFKLSILLGFVALVILPVVAFVAPYFFWQMTKTAEGRKPRMNSVERVWWLRALVRGDTQTMDALEAAVEARKREAANPTKTDTRTIADASKGAANALVRGLRKLV